MRSWEEVDPEAEQTYRQTVERLFRDDVDLDTFDDHPTMPVLNRIIFGKTKLPITRAHQIEQEVLDQILLEEGDWT